VAELLRRGGGPVPLHPRVVRWARRSTRPASSRAVDRSVPSTCPTATSSAVARACGKARTQVHRWLQRFHLRAEDNRR